MAEGVDADENFREREGIVPVEFEPFFLPERVEQFAVDVCFRALLCDSEDLGLKLALELFRVESSDLGEFHDALPGREVPEVVDALLGDARVDAVCACEGVGDVPRREKRRGGGGHRGGVHLARVQRKWTHLKWKSPSAFAFLIMATTSLNHVPSRAGVVTGGGKDQPRHGRREWRR